MPGSSLRCDHGWVGRCVTNHTSAGFPFSFPSRPNDVSSLAFCCSSTSGAVLPSCPASLDGSSWCSWEHQAHDTEQNQQPRQCPGCVLMDIQEHPKQRCQTIQTRNNNSRTAWKQLVSLLIWDIVTAKSMDVALPWHHWEASISLTTKRSKGTAGEMNALCLPVPYVYT